MKDIDEKIPGAPHFRWREFIRSATASLLDIDNRPVDDAVWDRIAYLAVNVLEPLRVHFGLVKVNSGYRCPALNRAVGGSNRSFHAFGSAADIVPLYADAGFSTKDMFSYIYKALPFTELIAEDVPGGWVHVALEKGRDREGQLKYKLPGGSVRKGTYDQIMGLFGER